MGVSAPAVDGYRVGDAGQAATIYEGYTLAYADDFTGAWDDLFVVPHKSPSSAASIGANKYLSFQTYRVGARQPGGQLTQSTDTDPFNTGTNDANRGVPVGSSNNAISSSVLRLRGKAASAGELTAYGAARKLVSGVLMSDLAVVAYPDAAGTADVIYEVRYKRSSSGSPDGGHTDFWTRSAEPDFNGSTTFDVNHENFSWNYLPATLDPLRDPGGDTEHIGTNDASNWHLYSMLLSKSHTDGIKAYRDGVIEYTGHSSSNAEDQNKRFLLTNHIVDSEAGDLAGWLAGAIYDMEIDYIRVWNRTAAKRYRPLATVADVNIAAGGSTTITLPAAATLWGEVPTVEYVKQLQGEVNSPGGSDTTQFTNAAPFAPGVSYNAGTRQLTVAPSDGKSGRMIFSVYARSPGSTCQPLIVVVNVGPKINFASLSYTPGVAGSVDVYPLVDCGELVTNGTNKAKTISFTGLPTGFSYSDATGLLSWTTAATFSGNVTIDATNSIGQTASRTVALSTASVPVDGEDAVTTAYVNAMTVSPSQTRREHLNTLIAGLRTDGLLAKLGRLVLFAAHDQQAGLLDAMQPAKSWSMVSGGTFTTDRGIAGDGTASYISMGEFATVAGTLGTQNDITIGVWCNQQNGATSLLPHVSEFGGTARYLIQARGAAGNETFRASDGSADVLRASTNTRLGHRTLSRTAAGVKRGFYNGARTADLTTASTGPAQGNLILLKNSTTYCPDRIAAAYVGSGLSDAEVGNLHTRLNTFLTAIGAA